MLVVASAAHADGLRTTPVGYDHLLHDRNLIVGGAEALPCARCHVVQAGRLAGKPGHATCFGACHGAPPRAGAKLDPDRKKLCTACHAEAQIAAGRFVVAYPPYTIDPDFNLALGHKQHAEVACMQCHPAKKPAPHARCLGCHDGTRATAMTKCATCHPPASGKPQPPELAATHDTVTATFSHGTHAARGGAGKDCTTCHAAIRATDDSELPRPTVTDCAAAGCHDGRAAFATTASCTRCHDKPPEKFDVARPDARYRHDSPGHAKLGACATCHALDARGEPVVAGHAACAAAGCHADDFGARAPKICGACHTATEPWRHLVADRGYPEATEFGATLDHRAHGKAACRTCHMLDTAAAQLQMPRGHDACTTAGCHAASSGPAPRLGECAGCHALGRQAARLANRAADPWSVRGAFDHARHQQTPDRGELACTACHVDMSGATLEALATPAKATCAPCHDGRSAFSLTGTSCTRCHAGAPR